MVKGWGATSTILYEYGGGGFGLGLAGSTVSGKINSGGVANENRYGSLPRGTLYGILERGVCCFCFFDFCVFDFHWHTSVEGQKLFILLCELFFLFA